MNVLNGLEDTQTSFLVAVQEFLDRHCCEKGLVKEESLNSVVYHLISQHMTAGTIIRKLVILEPNGLLFVLKYWAFMKFNQSTNYIPTATW